MNTGSVLELVTRVVRRIWRIVRWPLLVLLVLYIGLVIYRIPYVLEQKKTAEAVPKIHAARLTMADVDGSHLPPDPDPKLVDATVEGIDANQNGIRDDVELAIFAKYPGKENMKVRAAALQYAKALQMEFTDVFSTGTFIAVVQEESRAYMCGGESIPGFVDTIHPERPIKSLVFNTELRKQTHEDVFNKYMTSHGDGGNTVYCDL